MAGERERSHERKGSQRAAERAAKDCPPRYITHVFSSKISDKCWRFFTKAGSGLYRSFGIQFGADATRGSAGLRVAHAKKSATAGDTITRSNRPIEVGSALHGDAARGHGVEKEWD